MTHESTERWATTQQQASVMPVHKYRPYHETFSVDLPVQAPQETAGKGEAAR